MKTQKIAIGGRIKISPDFIILLEAQTNYTRLYLENGEQLIVATTLKELEKRFGLLQNFYRPHKSHIVNLEFLTEYRQETQELIMQNQMIVLLSRRRRRRFLSLFPAN